MNRFNLSLVNLCITIVALYNRRYKLLSAVSVYCSCVNAARTALEKAEREREKHELTKKHKKETMTEIKW